jgi:aminotransferase
MKERTVVINSFSKSYAMTGWRVGYAAGPAAIIDRMTKCHENINSCASTPGQYAAAMALDHPECCAALRDVFTRRRELILNELSAIEGIRFNVPQGAFYVFPDISAFGLSSEEFCNRLLEEQHVVCIPGSAFGACGEGFIRMSYTCSEGDIKEAMLRIGRFCSQLVAGK